TFLTAEVTRTVKQAWCKPFEADRDFPELAIKASDYTINEATADKSLPDDRGHRPLGTMSEKVSDSDSEVMVRVHQAGGPGDDSVTVCVRVIAKRDVEAILEFDQAGHGIGAGAIHADFAIMIYRHEGKSRVYVRIHDRNVQAVPVCDRFPVSQ